MSASDVDDDDVGYEEPCFDEVRVMGEGEQRRQILTIVQPLFLNLPGEYQESVNLDALVREALQWLAEYPSIKDDKLTHFLRCLLSTRLVQYELAKMARNRAKDQATGEPLPVSELEDFCRKTIIASIRMPAVEGLGKLWHLDKKEVAKELLQTTLLKVSTISSGTCKNWPLWRTDDNAPKSFSKWMWWTLRKVAGEEYKKEKLRHGAHSPVRKESRAPDDEDQSTLGEELEKLDDVQIAPSFLEEESIVDEQNSSSRRTEDALEDASLANEHVVTVNETAANAKEEAEAADRTDDYALFEACLEKIEQSRARSKPVAKAVLLMWLDDPTYKVREMLETLNDCLRDLAEKIASEYCRYLWLYCGLGMNEVTAQDIENARDLIQDRCRALATNWR